MVHEMVPPSALGMVVALAMVTTAAGQNSCADYRRDHAAIFLVRPSHLTLAHSFFGVGVSVSVGVGV
jgi:hypothetical protein